MKTNCHELIQSYLSGTCSPEEFHELEKGLKSDDAVAQLYLQYMNLDVALAAQASSSEATRVLLTGFAGRDMQLQKSYRKWYALSLVTTVVAICIGLVIWRWTVGVGIEVVSVTGAPESAWRSGDHLRLKHLSWVRGSLELRLPSGVQLKIASPAELQLINPMRVQVVSGKITADVGPQGKGFVIETPQTRIVDLGTRFGVDASHTEHTDVVVFEGQVELYQQGTQARMALLNQGEGLRVASHRRTARIMSVTKGEDVDAWSTQGLPAANAIITDVQDSMVANDEEAKKWPSLKNFYQIVPGGLQDRTHAFADELDEWSAVPASLAEADLVRTFAVDGFNWWMQMQVTVGKPCDLFVFVDARNEVPPWLAAEFTPTGETITLNRISRKTSRQIKQPLEFVIWKKAVSQPGIIKLGPPYANPPADRKSFSPNRMYGVAAKNLP
jgi:ferric-dicitrate binding protein FerR (iron transport regulator)